MVFQPDQLWTPSLSTEDWRFWDAAFFRFAMFRTCAVLLAANPGHNQQDTAESQ